MSHYEAKKGEKSMEIKEAKEIIIAGLTWGNLTYEQREAMKKAYTSMDKAEELKEKVRHYEMMYHNTGAMFNRMTMKEKIERYEKALDDIKNLSTLNEYADADINGLLNACYQVANKAKPTIV